jgi:type IV secretory pathway VirB4 component
MIFRRSEAPFPPIKLVPESPAIPDQVHTTGILLGQSTHWDPLTLPNPHVVVIGASGSGKTQTLKALAYELSQHRQANVRLIDFHGDQSLPGEVVYPLHMASPYGINPLQVNLDPEGGGPHLQAIQVAMLLRKTLTLGPIQEGLLLDILKNLYAEQEILQSKPDTWTKDPPTFAHLEQNITKQVEEGNNDYTKLQIKLAATFSYGIFSRPQPEFTDPLIRLDVSKLPPALGSIAAESLAHQLMNQHRLAGETAAPRTFLFIDEAKEMPRTSGSALDRLITDGRKYGLALILASQSERHLSKEVIANSATKVVLPVDQTEVKTVARKFRFAEHLIAQLQPLTALVRLGSRAAHVEILPYYRRVTLAAKTESLQEAHPQSQANRESRDGLQNPGFPAPELELQPETTVR